MSLYPAPAWPHSGCSDWGPQATTTTTTTRRLEVQDQGTGFGETSLPGMWTASSHCVLTWQRGQAALCGFLSLSLSFFFFSFLLLGPHPRHIEVPRGGLIQAVTASLHHSHSHAGS